MEVGRILQIVPTHLIFCRCLQFSFILCLTTFGYYPKKILKNSVGNFLLSSFEQLDIEKQPNRAYTNEYCHLQCYRFNLCKKIFRLLLQDQSFPKQVAMSVYPFQLTVEELFLIPWTISLIKYELPIQSNSHIHKPVVKSNLKCLEHAKIHFHRTSLELKLSKLYILVLKDSFKMQLSERDEFLLWWYLSNLFSIA